MSFRLLRRVRSKGPPSHSGSILSQGGYRQLLEADDDCTLTSEQLDEVFDPWAFLSRIGVLFERVEGLEF